MTLLVATRGVKGCFRGRPRGRFGLGCMSVGLVLLGTGVGGASLISSRRTSSSIGSTLGTASSSSEPWSHCMSCSVMTWAMLVSSATSPPYTKLQESAIDEDSECDMGGAFMGPMVGQPLSSVAGPGGTSMPVLMGDS